MKASFEQLLKGKHIYRNMDEQIVYGELADNEEVVWSLLVASGYLKIVSYPICRKIPCFSYGECQIIGKECRDGRSG